MTSSQLLRELEQLMRAAPAPHGWDVRSELTYPGFWGGYEERTETAGHGVYTTREVFAPGQCLMGWIDETGYTLTGYVADGPDAHEPGGYSAQLSNGPIRVHITFTPHDPAARY